LFYRIFFKWILFLLVVLTAAPSFAENRKNQNPRLFSPNLKLDVDPFYQQIVNQVSYDSIYSYLQKLESFGVKNPGSTALVNARDWLHDKLAAYGYTDIVYHDFTYSSHTLQNIITTKPGTAQPGVYLILDGHYDTITGPGVNDNGSGTAILLEVARLLANIDCRVSIRFINFSAEEEGLIGSAAYVSNVVVPQNMNIRLVLNIDEVGGIAGQTNDMVTCERDEGNPPGNNAASAAFTDTLAQLTQTYSALNTQIAHAYGSDYMPFEDAGYIITGFYESNESPYPHTANDILANMDPAYVTEIAKASVAAALYFSRAESSYLSLYHSPVTTVQDTTNPYPVQLKIRSSSGVTGAVANYRVDSGNFAAVPLTFSWQSGDTLIYDGVIPPQPYFSTIDYYFSADNQDSLHSRLPEDSAAFYSFQVLPDTAGPQLQHQPLADLSYLINPITFSVNVTDENGISGVTLFIHRNAEPDQELSLSPQGGSRFSVVFTESLTPGDSVFYRFEAIDNSANHNTTWLPASGYQAFEVLNSELFDFEISNNAFTGNGDWAWGNFNDAALPQPSGTKVWATNLTGNYSPNQQSLLETPEIDLTGKYDARLVISQFYQIEPVNDGGNVKVSVDSGNFQVIAPQEGYPYASLYLFNEPGYSGNSYFWEENSFDLSQYSGHRVQFMFDFRSDVFTNKKGWYIDFARLDFRGTQTNRPPAITQFSPEQLDTVLLDATQQFSISATDPDGDSLLYAFYHGNETVADSQASFTFHSTGYDTVVATVEDIYGHSTSYTWIFMVQGPVSVNSRNPQAVNRYFLYPAYPNPFNPETKINFEMQQGGNVEILVYNTLGQMIEKSVNGYRSAGSHSVSFSGNSLPSGFYFIVMKTGTFEMTQRILLMR